LKFSSIKFEQDEFGSILRGSIDDNVGTKSLTPGILQEHDSPVFNKKSTLNQNSNNFVDHNTGQLISKGRSKTSQNKHRNKIHAVANSVITLSSGGLSPKKMKTGSAMQTYNSNASPGLKPKPYDLWRQNMVVANDSVSLGENHQIKLVFDQSSKSHLTSAKGAPNLNSYTS